MHKQCLWVRRPSHLGTYSAQGCGRGYVEQLPARSLRGNTGLPHGRRRGYAGGGVCIGPQRGLLNAQKKG